MEMPMDILLQSLHDFRAELLTAEGKAEDATALQRAGRALLRIEKALARPLRVGVFGDEKSGKSSLINYFMGEQVLPSGAFSGVKTQAVIRYAEEPAMYTIHPDGKRSRLTSKALARMAMPEKKTPSKIANIIYNAADPAQRCSPSSAVTANMMSALGIHAPAEATKLIEIGLPHNLLRLVEIIETREFPSAPPDSPISKTVMPIDLAIWCTLATQAWKESERSEWRRIPPGRRQLALMVVTYKDAVRAPDERKVLARLRHDSAGFAFNDIVLVSLRDALEAQNALDKEAADYLRERSNSQVLEATITALADHWRQHRFRKAAMQLAQISTMIEHRLGSSASGNGNSLAARLYALAEAFINLSDTISFAEQAA